MTLFDRGGNRKYLVARERRAFVLIASMQDNALGAFCLTLAITGARISEVLALTRAHIDTANSAIVFRTLKQRKRSVFRAVPVPEELLRRLGGIQMDAGQRLWPWGRTKAWKDVKALMLAAEIPERLCQPKALRHAFAVEAGQNGVPLNLVQRWLGHARIETTAIYAGALGEEERNLARRTWSSLDLTVTSQ
jgi:integrase/recombinase XerD